MRVLLAVILWSAIMGIAMYADAQSTPSALSTDPQQIQSVIEQSGCRYEITASAQTIANLQKQINDLQAQLKKLDPPKSGATKH